MKHLQRIPQKHINLINRSLCLTLILVWIPWTWTMGQTNSGGTKQKLPRESIALQTDRGMYIAGEQVWFRADYSANTFHPAPPISKVLYLELFNNEEKAVVQKKVSINNGKATGNFTLPADITSGTYRLRAYTKYQRNFPSQGFEQQSLVVINPNRPPETSPMARDSLHIDLAFEGGKLMKGVESKVAFLLDHSLLDMKKGVYLTREKEGILDTLKTWGNGLGSFRIKPSGTTPYQLMAVLNNGDTLTRTLPFPARSGRLVDIKVDKKSLTYRLRMVPETETSKFIGRLKVLTPALEMLAQKSIEMEKGMVRVNIPAYQLKEGLHFMLLEGPDGQPLQVNTVFVPFDKASKIHLHTRFNKYGRGQKIQLQADLQNNLQHAPVEGMLTVVRKGTFGAQSQNLPPSCIHHPLLIENYVRRSGSFTPQMKKQVELSSFFWDQKWQEPGQVKQLAKKYSNQPASPESLAFMPEIRDLTLNGTLVDQKSGQPVANEKLIASVLFGNPQIHFYKTRQNGDFSFTLHDLNGSREIFLSPYKRKSDSTSYRLRLRSNFSTNKPAPLHVPFPMGPEDQSFIEEIILNSQLHRHFQAHPMDKYDSALKPVSPIPSQDKISIRMSDYLELETMKEVFLELVPHARIREDEGHYSFEVLNDDNFALPGHPLILLDNLPVRDDDKIVQLHPSQIKKIEIINRTYILGEHTLNGVIMFTTESDNFAGIELPTSSTFTEYKSLSASSPFPSYQRKRESNPSLRQKPDFRNLLHWDPEFEIKKDAASTSFFSSDRTGEYEIIFRGYSPEGKFFSGKTTIVITRNEPR